MGVRCPVRRRVPASAPRAPAAQVRTFSPNASKLGVSGGNSGRRLDNALPSPRGADPPLTEMEGKRLLPPFLPPRGAGAVWHGRRGDRRGSCSGRGLGCFKHQLLFLTHVPECRWLWQTGIYRDDHTDAAGRLWEQGGNHSPGNFYPHLLLVIIFCSRSPVGKP